MRGRVTAFAVGVRDLSTLEETAAQPASRRPC